MASDVFWPISFSLPSERSIFSALSQKDLNLLDNPNSAIVFSLARPVFCSPSHELTAIVSPLEDSVQPGLSFDAIRVDVVSSQFGLIYSSQLVLNIH